MLTVITVATRAVGPVLLGDRELPPWSRSVIALLAPALLAGLIVVNVTGAHWSDLDWRLVAGLAVVAAVRLLKVHMVLAVLAGVVATAGLRALAVG